MRSAAATALALAALLAAGTPPANAASVDVAAGPLVACLEQVTRATGARFIVADGVDRTIRCRAVAGAAGVDAALAAAFAGQPLQWRLRDDGTWLVASATAAPSADLDTLTIEGDGAGDAAAPGADPRTPLPQPAPRVAALRSETRYDAAELSVKPLVRFGQIGRLAPNVYGSAESLSIRGVPRDNDYFSGVSVFFDGVDVGTLLLDNDVLAVDDLERLRYGRGASAFLHGGGSAGGAVYLDTAEPSPVWGGRVSAGGGQRSAYHGSASVTGPLGGGASARLAVSHAEQPRFVRNLTVTSIDGDTDTRDRASVKVLYEPDAVPQLTLAASAFGIQADAPDRFVARRASDPPSAIFDGVSFDSTARDWRLDALGAAVRGQWRFDSGAEIGVHASDLDVERVAPEDGGPLARVRLIDGERRARHGVQGAVPIGAAWRIHAGLEAQRVGTDRVRFVEAVEPVDVGPRSRRDTTALDIDGTSAALEVAWDAGGRWRATAGARRVEEDVVFATRVERDDVTSDELVTRSSYSRTLPAGGVEVDVARGQTLALRGDRAYRAGGRSELDFVGEYAPERLDTAELSWRGRFLDERLRATAAVFRTEWSDRTAIDGTIGARILEPIETRILGGELEVAYAATDRIDVRAGVGFLDSEYRRGRYAFDNRVFDVAGQRGVDAPRATAVLGASWQHERGWFAGVDAYHARPAASITFVGIGVPPERDAYTVVDARVGWRDESLSLAVNVGNALAERYIDRFADRRAFSRRVGAPRQVDVVATWSW